MSALGSRRCGSAFPAETRSSAPSPLGRIDNQQFAGRLKCQHTAALAQLDPDQAGAIGIALHSAHGAQGQARVGKRAQKFSRLVEHAGQLECRPGRAFCQGVPGRFLRGAERVAVGAGDRIAVGIDIGVAEEGIDPIDEQIADGMLHMFSLVMHLVP